MKHYTEDEIAVDLPGWTYKNTGVEKEFKFKNFSEAFGFMTRIAMFCEATDHHPEWTNVYNSIKVRLNTHSENAVTEKDIALALMMDSLA